MRARISGLLLLSIAGATASAGTLETVIERARQTTAGLRDFVCLMTFNIRSSSARVPESRVRIYYKAPDKFKPVPLDGDFTVVPKTYNVALGAVLDRMLEESRPVLLPNQAIDNRPHYVIKMVPKEEVPGIQYNLVYLDRETYLLRRIRTIPTEGAPVNMDIRHTLQGRIPMPSQIQLSGQQSRRGDDGQTRTETFSVTMNFSDYRVNRGIEDSVFEDQDK